MSETTHTQIGGKYEVLEILGRGGMGQVFKAQDKRLRRTVALKVMSPHLVADDEARARFEREARAGAQLEHDHIVTTYDYGFYNDQPYLAVSFIEGEMLADRIRRQDRLSPEKTVCLIAPIAEALAYAHSQGIIHRDVKSSNIMIRAKDERPILIDFGIAHASFSQTLTQLGYSLGTPMYMSPEQAAAEKTDGRSDLYSLGVVLYECLTGIVPFQSTNIAVLLYNILHEPHRPMRERVPEVPLWLSDVVDRCLAKKPGDRFPDGEALAKALRAGLASKPEVESIEVETTAAEAETTVLDIKTAATETEIAAPEIEVKTIEVETTAAEAETTVLDIKTAPLETEIATPEREVETIEVETTAAEAETTVLDIKTAPLETEIATPEKEVESIEVETTAAEAETTVLDIKTAATETETAATEVETTVPKTKRVVAEVAAVSRVISRVKDKRIVGALMVLLLLTAVSYGAANGWFVGLINGRTSSTEQSIKDSLLAETSTEGIPDEEAQGKPEDSASTRPETENAAPLTAEELRNVPQALRDALSNPTAVDRLDLRNLGLATVPESITQLTNLKQLILGDNRLKTVPESITQLTNLKQLYLGDNRLKTVPESITQLTNLEVLFLGDNQLKTVPESITQLTNLELLALGDNQLETVPESITQLTNLKRLYWGSNALKTVPESISQLTKLEWLDLSGNQLTTLPESITQLTKLKYLYLWGNPIPQAEQERIQRLLPNTEIKF